MNKKQVISIMKNKFYYKDKFQNCYNKKFYLIKNF